MRAPGGVGAAPRWRPPADRGLVFFLLRSGASLSPSLFERRTVWSVSGLTTARSASAWDGASEDHQQAEAWDTQVQGPGASGFQTSASQEQEGDLTRTPITRPPRPPGGFLLAQAHAHCQGRAQLEAPRVKPGGGCVRPQGAGAG